jgi:hypothetical protein
MAFVYFFGSRDGGFVKIGMTGDSDTKKRLGQIQVGCPHKLTLFGLIQCRSDEDARLAERKLHCALSLYRMNGEWFKISPFITTLLNELESLTPDQKIIFKSLYPTMLIGAILQRSVQPKKPELSKDFLIDLLSAALIDSDQRNAKMAACFEVMKVAHSRFQYIFEESAVSYATVNPSDTEKRARILSNALMSSAHNEMFSSLSKDEILEEFVVGVENLEDAIDNSKAVPYP